MAVRRTDFVQDLYVDTYWRSVVDLADSLAAHLEEPDAAALLEQANQPDLSSALVQAVFLQEAVELGLADESKGLSVRTSFFDPTTSCGSVTPGSSSNATMCPRAITPSWPVGSRRSSGRPPTRLLVAWC